MKEGESMQPIKKAIILCAGLATRMLPITKTVPKEMLPLLDKPILHRLVEDCANCGIQEIAMIMSDQKNSIIDYFERNYHYEKKLEQYQHYDQLELVKNISNLASITYIIQKETKGTMIAVNDGKKFVKNEPFLLLFGDEYVSCKTKTEIAQLLDAYEQLGSANILALQPVDKKDVSRYGIIQPLEQHGDIITISQFVEKPPVEKAPSNISYIGPAILDPSIFTMIDEFLHQNQKPLIEYPITLLYSKLAEQQQLHGVLIHGKRYDLGNKLGFIQANVLESLLDDRFSEDMKKFLQNIVSSWDK